MKTHLPKIITLALSLMITLWMFYAVHHPGQNHKALTAFYILCNTSGLLYAILALRKNYKSTPPRPPTPTDAIGIGLLITASIYAIMTTAQDGNHFLPTSINDMIDDTIATLLTLSGVFLIELKTPQNNPAHDNPKHHQH